MRVSDTVFIFVGVVVFVGTPLCIIGGIEWVWPSVCTTKTVKSIGGCNARGVCGVAFTDETFGAAGYPSVGQSVSVCGRR